MITTILDSLNINIMKEGAALFQGEHNFKTYCYKPSKNSVFIRSIDCCELVENTIYEVKHENIQKVSFIEDFIF